MKPAYPNEIPISVGDIFIPRYSTCYGRVLSIDLIEDISGKRSDWDHYSVKFKKICGASFKPYKNAKDGTVVYYVRQGLPYKLEPDSFEQGLINLQNLIGMIK